MTDFLSRLISTEISSRLFRYVSIEAADLSKHLEGTPAFANCLIMALSPDQAEVTSLLFLPEGHIFDSGEILNMLGDAQSMDMLFFSASVCEVPIFSFSGSFRPLRFKGEEKWTLLRKQMRHETRALDVFRKASINALSAYTCFQLLRELATTQPDIYQKLIRDASDERLMKVLEHLHSTLGQEVEMDVLGSMINLSEDYMSQFFKRTFQINLQQYMMHQKVLHGLQTLVSREDLSLYHIADQIGFTDQAYFNRRFRAEYNMNPIQVRKVYRSLFKETKAALL